MTNPLVDFKNLVTGKTFSTTLGKVVSVMGDKVCVKLSSGVTVLVWGKAAINDSVMMKNAQIIAVVNEEKTPIVYVA